MNDDQILGRVKSLTAKEEGLWRKSNLTNDEVNELHKIKLELDQCWDLLHQRRALRDAHQNPNRAEVRDIDTIENYKR